MSKVRDNIIWLAGILEGEGCFRQDKNTPRITVNMTDEDIIHKIASMFNVSYKKMGGKVRESYKNWKPCYSVTINGAQAVGIMFSIYSLMGQRRKSKIKEIIEAWKKVPIHPKRKINSRIKEFIKEDFKLGLSYNDLSKKYNLCYASVWNVVNNRTWKNV